MAQRECHHRILMPAGKTDVLEMLSRDDARAIGEIDELSGIVVMQGIQTTVNESELLEKREAAQGDKVSALGTYATDVIDVSRHTHFAKLGNAKDIGSCLHILGDLGKCVGRILVPAPTIDEQIGIGIA